MLKTLDAKSVQDSLYDPLMQQITDAIRARLPQATAIIFFGSRVAGVADAFSDYDVMVVMPDGLDMDERKRVKQELQSSFPNAKLDLVFGSERRLRSSLPYYPFYRFWLKDSVATWGKINIKRFPPLSVGAMKSYLGILKAEIELADALEDRHRGSRVGIEALELLTEIELGFKRDYSTRAVKQAVTEFVGSDLVLRIRDPHSRLTEKDRQLLVHRARKKYRLVKAMLETMRQTSSDRRWRKKWAGNRAKKSSKAERNA
jgi:predicted nucleotidyltransferase